jgi:hypothetical protein
MAGTSCLGEGHQSLTEGSSNYDTMPLSPVSLPWSAICDSLVRVDFI